jgi:hypothetical protein
MKTIPQKAGIYALVSLKANLIYIGGTRNLQVRKNLHTSTIRGNDAERGCKPMVEAHHDGDEITFGVLEICDNIEEREQYWIEYYRDAPPLRLVNVFDATRSGSSVPEDFRSKLSVIRKEKWKDPEYRQKTTDRLRVTQFTAEQLSKPVLVFGEGGDFKGLWPSARGAAAACGCHPTSVSAAARGDFGGKFKHKGYIFMYLWVLYKLGELLETHQYLRAISNQSIVRATQAIAGSTTNS